MFLIILFLRFLIVASADLSEKKVDKRQILVPYHYVQYTQQNLTRYLLPSVSIPLTRYQLQPHSHNVFGSFPFNNWPFLPISIPQQPTNQLEDTPQPVQDSTVSDENDILASKQLANCGTAAVYAQTRIVNGENAQYGEFPWLVAIMRDDGRTHLCGGSLISDMHVLSAAHCFKSYRADDVHKLRIFIGDYNIYDSNDVRHQVRSVDKLIRHKQWNSPVNFNDVALLKLKSPVQFNSYVQPVCLPTNRGTAQFYSAGGTATVAGWGKVQWGNPSLQSTPLKIEIPLVDKYTCQNSVSPNQIADSMVCAGAGYKSTCLGDSGGPLVVFKNGKWYQIGIVSWGLNCGGYGVFTKVSSFRDWIEKYSRY